ncbi:MAG: 3-isopropylmalate dehydratase small subunit [Verrucomicrobiota bacterium]
MKKIERISGRAVHVPGSDVDTDRIIPARFMKCVTFDGLGEFLFYDVRKDEEGDDREHPLNESRFEGASILLAGSNFGCGSSREHAPQALYRYGFRGLIAESYAEIFFGNCTTLGVPCVTASGEDIRKLAAAVEADPQLEITIDLENERVVFGDQHLPASLPGSAREALLNGRWDPIAELQDNEAVVDERLQSLGYAC